ncbi:hypothetical protein JCM8097_007524 [Rhodosporidiobolus ruineniae]
MSPVKIFGWEGNPRTRTALVTAVYEGIDVQLVRVAPFEGLTAEYTAKFPLGLVPALEDGDYQLTEVLAIAQYLASKENKNNLLGSSVEDKAQVTRWASWANADLLPALGAWFRPLSGAAPYQKPAVEAAKAKALKHLAYLEDVLATRTFLVGERVTIADVHVASVLFRGFENVLDAEWRKAHPNTVRFWQTVYHQEPFFAVLGGVEPRPVETAIVYTPPKKEEKPKAKKEEKPKEKAAPKPKAPEPKEEEEEAAPAEPKAKHPCEALGPAKSFPLDEWKRQYSNNDTPVAIKWLDEQIAANPAVLQEYSFVRADFKYPEELTQVFMSANQVTGLHTRLEGSRKYLFGSMGVYGKANDSLISGAYMMRGSDIEGVFSVAPDWESYNFTPLDYVKDKDFIVGAWSWEHTLDGKEYADGKVFK